MGLFNFFKKKKQDDVVSNKTEDKESSKILLAMPLFKNNETYEINKVIEHLKTYWGLSVDGSDDINNESAVFYINGQMVAIAYMPVPIPMEDIEEIAP